MSTECWWNDMGKENPDYPEKPLSHCQFLHHKSAMDCPGIELVALRWEVGD